MWGMHSPWSKTDGSDPENFMAWGGEGELEEHSDAGNAFANTVSGSGI